MKLQLLPSTIDADGKASLRQHLLSIVIDDRVAIDAGSLAFSCNDLQRNQIRDIVLTHTHLDHIAGLPLYIDDLFATLTEPVRVHATREMIDILEANIFNWSIYPRFSELKNEYGAVVEYKEFEKGAAFTAGHLSFKSIAVNHKVSANGYIVSDGNSSIGITGDTAETDEFWLECNRTDGLNAILIECAFPNELSDLASVSYHLTPNRIGHELTKLEGYDGPVYVINIKPMYREKVLAQLGQESIPNLQILDLGTIYEF